MYILELKILIKNFEKIFIFHFKIELIKFNSFFVHVSLKQIHIHYLYFFLHFNLLSINKKIYKSFFYIN